MTFVGIYDSDSGVVAEMRYAFNKVRGRSHCSLCSITHGWNPLGRKSWKQALADSPVEIKMIHRDKADESQMAAANGLPSLLRSVDGKWVEAMSSSELATFETAPVALLERLEITNKE